MKIGLKIAAVFVGLIVLLFNLELLGLGWTRFFSPKRQNIQREVFEETKSYVHGKIQDLAKYYDEYQKSDSPDDKEAIQTVIKSQFAEFDAEKINSSQLRTFLVNMRGY